MAEKVPHQRRRLVIELVVCTLLVLVYSVYGLWRMDYLSPRTAEQVRMTDSSRTAYVAKNIVEGRGYTTNELPAYLVDFYDQKGKLHQDLWPNADRFPFTAYAVAALYEVTGSTSYEVGILGYNLICFTAFLVLLYWLSRVVWNDRWAALCTLGIALLHPLTYVYLYLKDADMMLLVTGLMAALFGYFRHRPEELSSKRAVGIGTLLAWLWLARPNIGGAFLAYLGLVVLRRIWVGRRQDGLGATLRAMAKREGLALGVFVLWCLPFVIHSMSVWGSPMFSANAIYQLPLGTRYAMDTDTWWKYSEPGTVVTLGTLFHHALGELIAKFTTSWVVTLKVIVRAYALELLLGFGVIAWLATRTSTADGDPSEQDRHQSFRRLARLVGFAVLLNFLVLPLYGYQNYGYRHYLSFYLPLIWIACGQGLVLLWSRIRPVLSDVRTRMRDRWGLVLAAVAIILLAWNCSYRSQEANRMFAATGRLLGKHWLTVALALAAMALYRPLRRLRWQPFTAGVIVTASLVMFRYQPMLETKRLNLNWFPLNDKVWDVLRERKGLVMSFAMQGEVNWASGRKDIPAPEFMMHVYSLLFDHGLEVEDVFIENASALVGPWDGAFYYAAPGFESYVRMEKYQGRLPGYKIVFHDAGMRGYAKYQVKPRWKASTIYRLVDRAAVRAMARSPDRIELGSVDNVVYTAHGWGDYFTLDGRPAVAATASTRERYLADVPERPYEDTAVTFFLDDRRPSSVDLDIYATHAAKLEFYWNLDLYKYDLPEDRHAHAIGTYAVTNPGWQTIHLDIPAGVTRKGFNKLGFRTSSFRAVTICPPTTSAAACAMQRPRPLGPGAPTDEELLVLQDTSVKEVTSMYASLFAGTLTFHYPLTTKALTTPR